MWNIVLCSHNFLISPVFTALKMFIKNYLKELTKRVGGNTWRERGDEGGTEGGREGGRKREKENTRALTSFHWFTLPVGIMARDGPGRNQEPGAWLRSPHRCQGPGTWVTAFPSTKVGICNTAEQDFSQHSNGMLDCWGNLTCSITTLVLFVNFDCSSLPIPYVVF